MRKIALAVLFTPALAQTPAVTLSLGAPPPAIAPGSSGAVSLNISSVAGSEPAGVQFTLSYGPEISAVVVSAGPATTAAGKTLYCNTPANGKITCLAIGLNADKIANGALATIQATIGPTVTSSSTSASLSLLVAADLNGTSLAIGSAAALAIAIAPSACDLNRDGKIDSVDLLVLVNQILGVTQCGNADLDKNGKCELADAFRLITAATGGGCKTGP